MVAIVVRWCTVQEMKNLAVYFLDCGGAVVRWCEKITSVSKGMGICARPLLPFWQFYACPRAVSRQKSDFDENWGH